MPWTQEYDPVHRIPLSALLAALPILVLFFALAVRRLPGHKGGPMALIVAAGTAYLAWRLPMRLILLAGLHGALFGLFPVGWIIVAALFLFNITVETGHFALVKESVARLSADRRIQALLIAFAFGAFLEGAAGFGAPVAISTAMLVGLGFEPLRAAGVSLLANTAPVAFAGFGIPLVTLAGVTGLDLNALSAMVGRQLPLLSAVLPAWLVVLVAGWRGLRGVWPAALVAGLFFALTQWWSANHLGPYLPDLLSALVSTGALLLLLRFWRPAAVWRFPHEGGAKADRPADGARPAAVLRAWAPFLLLTFLVLLWNLPPVRRVLDAATLKPVIPGLHLAIRRVPPAVPAPEPYPAVFTFNWLSVPGTALFLTSLLSMALLGLGARQGLQILARTVSQLKAPLLTILSVLALAFIMNYAGMSTTLGLAFTRVGKIYPFFAPLLGWLGVFLTGSDTSANALFGKLQAVTAGQIGADPVLVAAANTTGGVTGKMISPQSIAVAAASADLTGREGTLFRYTIAHSLILAVALGALTLLQAYVWRWMVP